MPIMAEIVSKWNEQDQEMENRGRLCIGRLIDHFEARICQGKWKTDTELLADMKTLLDLYLMIDAQPPPGILYSLDLYRQTATRRIEKFLRAREILNSSGEISLELIAIKQRKENWSTLETQDHVNQLQYENKRFSNPDGKIRNLDPRFDNGRKGRT